MRRYEDFTVGDVYRSAVGRTVTETDNLLFTMLALNTNELHFNEEAAKATEWGRILVNSTFTLALVLGLSVADTTQAGAGSHCAARATMASATRSGSSDEFTSRITSASTSARDRRLRSALCNGRRRLARSTLVDGNGDRRPRAGTRVPDGRRRRGCGMPDPSKSFYPP